MNKAQELRRSFRFLSIFGYSLILGNGWVIALVSAIIPLTNGSSAGGIWMYLIVIIGMTFSTLSMAEMASMAPTAGGQYREQRTVLGAQSNIEVLTVEQTGYPSSHPVDTNNCCRT